MLLIPRRIWHILKKKKKNELNVSVPQPGIECPCIKIVKLFNLASTVALVKTAVLLRIVNLQLTVY